MSAQIEDAGLRSLVYLWLEIASTHLLMWLANPGGLHTFQPHVHRYLADRYGHLAAVYRRRSKFRKAARLEEKAGLHLELGGDEDPPPAAALALGSTQRQIRVDAEGSGDPPPSKGKRLRIVPKRPPYTPDQIGRV